MTPTDKVAKEIAIQAELIALNVALEGQEAEQASEALYALSRQIREGAPRMHVAGRTAQTGGGSNADFAGPGMHGRGTGC